MSQASGSGGKEQEVKQAIEDTLLEEAVEAGVDADQIIQEKAATHSDYSPATIARFAVSAIKQRIEAQDAEILKGILCGSRDRHGRGWPRRFSLIRSSGDHIELSNWDGHLPTPDGNEARVPSGDIAEIRAVYDDEYDSWEAKQLDSVKRLDRPDLVERLSKIVKTPSQIGAKDEYEIQVVKGTVNSVSPQTLFEEGEPAGDGDVLMEDGRGEMLPHLEISFEYDGTTLLRAHLERQSNGRPLIDLPDFEQLCREAYTRESPSDQASFLESGLQGAEIIVVGNVQSHDTNRNDDGQVFEYVDIAVSALIDASPDASLGEFETQTASDAVEEEDEEDVDESEGRDIEDVKDDIGTYLDLTGMDASELTAETVLDNMDLDDPEAVIEAAIDELAGGSEDEAEGEDEAEDVEREYPSLWDDDAGMYVCPGEDGDCIARAGNIDDLLAHAMEAHDVAVGTADEWLGDQL